MEISSPGNYMVLQVLFKLFEMLFSKQIAEFFERILSKCQCGFLLGKAMGCNIAYKWCLKLEKKATNNKKSVLRIWLFKCWFIDC